MKFYTGVGSRQTPGEILEVMKQVAIKLASLGWVARTGDAVGADAAFREAKNTRIYTAKHSNAECEAMSRRFHPAWDRMSRYAQQLHGRNAKQVLGDQLNAPSRFLICWTPDGATTHKERSIRTGGTGTAISVAATHGVEVFNLARADHLERVKRFVGLA